MNTAKAGSAGNSGLISLSTGDSTAGDSGDILIGTGAATGGR